MSNLSILEELNKAEKLINDGQIKEALKFITRFEQKALTQSLKGDLDKPLDVYLKCKEFYEKIGKKSYIANNFSNLGNLYLRKGDFNAGLDYGMKCLTLWEELKNQQGIAVGLSLVGKAYNYKGKLDLAMEYCKRSLSITEISVHTKVESLYFLGDIYFWKGELQQCLKYCKKSLDIAEEKNMDIFISLNLSIIGGAYHFLGEYKTAIKCAERSLTIAEKIEFPLMIGMTLLGLIRNYDSLGSRNKTQGYLKRLKEHVDDKKENRFLNHAYMISRAIILISSGRSRDRAQAESLLKQLVEEKISNPPIYIMGLNALLIFLLEELRISNNLEVLDELNPLITRFHDITEKTHSYWLLTSGKLFEAKLAIIQMNFDKAKKLLTEAQRVAELRGFHTLAQSISTEHDLLLRQQNIWDEFKETDAPLSEKIKLASFDGVIEQMRGRRVVDPPELIDEQSTLLLIIAEGGVLIFSLPFTEEWKRDDSLFSGFLSAFTTFSSEFFTKGLDRAKFGDDLIIMQSVGPFSFCYLFKGQSYLATQRLTRFTERIKNNVSIWQTLENYYETSQVLDVKESPALESLIAEIFITKSIDLIE